MNTRTPALFIFLSIFTVNAWAQPTVRQKPCTDLVISKSSDSLVQFFRSKNFQLMHSASLTMESEYESGIIVDLKKKEWYVLVFIGDATSKLFEVRMYDWEENRVAFEKQKSYDKEANIVIFSYKPEASGYHMIKPLQSNKKKKSICGQVMLFKKDLS